MNILLDTHSFIWFFNGDEQLPVAIKEMIENISNNCFISIGSIWEIAIKVNLGKLDLMGDFTSIASFISENRIEIVPVTFKHVEKLLRLSLHHRDPFDRIIIAQAISEDLTVATKDIIFHHYGVKIIWQ